MAQWDGEIALHFGPSGRAWELASERAWALLERVAGHDVYVEARSTGKIKVQRPGEDEYHVIRVHYIEKFDARGRQLGVYCILPYFGLRPRADNPKGFETIGPAELVTFVGDHLLALWLVMKYDPERVRRVGIYTGY